MAAAVMSRVRLFPLLIAVAVIALSARLVDVYAGASLLGDTAFAAPQEAESEPQETDGDTEQTDVAPAPRTPVLPDPSVRDLNTQLRQRRVALEARERALDTQVALLEASEKRIDDKIAQLQLLETAIKDSLRIFNEREEREFAKVVKIYETMKPKAAAPIFENLPGEVQLDIATRMKEAKFAPILAAMDPAKARDLTTNLAAFAQPPSIEELGLNSQ